MRKLLAILAAVAFTLTIPAPAAAAPIGSGTGGTSYGDCSKWMFYAVEHSDATGMEYIFCRPTNGTPIDMTRHRNVPSAFNDKASAWCISHDAFAIRNKVMTVMFYFNINQSSPMFVRRAWYGQGAVCGGFSWWENDKLSSITVMFQTAA
jgi:hypothetical protein